MDTIGIYQKIVEQVLRKHIQLPSSQFPAIQDILIIDSDKRHFIVLSMGWNDQKYIHQVAFHIEVKSNGQVWIHENRTDVLIDEELINEGIPAKNIIPGMLEGYPERGVDTQAA